MYKVLGSSAGAHKGGIKFLEGIRDHLCSCPSFISGDEIHHQYTT